MERTGGVKGANLAEERRCGQKMQVGELGRKKAIEMTNGMKSWDDARNMRAATLFNYSAAPKSRMPAADLVDLTGISNGGILGM